MPAHIALASCSLWPTGSGDHAGLAEAAADRGVRAEWVPWDDPTVEWSDYDLVLLRETWDYRPKLAAFLAWVDSVAKLTSLVNPSAVVRWNHHKRYLQELAALGVTTVPTTVVTRGSTDPHATVRAADAATVVVKPAVGIGGNDAGRGPGRRPCHGGAPLYLHTVPAATERLADLVVAALTP